MFLKNPIFIEKRNVQSNETNHEYIHQREKGKEDESRHFASTIFPGYRWLEQQSWRREVKAFDGTAESRSRNSVSFLSLPLV